LENQLTPQQLEGIDFIKQHNYRCLVADVAGAGKTYMILSALSQNNYPCLVICIKVGLPVWKNELLKWFNEPSIIYAGTPKQRQELQQNVKSSKFVIATYAMFDELIDTFGINYFKTLILDEYHMYGLLNRKTHFFESVNKLSRIIPYWLPTTGSPRKKNPSDFYPALHLLDPTNKEDGLNAFWNFVDTHCIKIKGFFGFEIERMPRNVEGFQNFLAKYMISRPCDDLPLKLRQAIPVEMSKVQRKLYEQLQKEMMLETEGENKRFILTPNQMTKILRCRQLLVTPRIFGEDDNGGGLEAVVELTQQELSEDNPVIIFTPFTEAIQYIEQALKQANPETVIIPIHGGFSVKQYEKAQNDFQTLSTKNKVVIASIRSGASITLTEAAVTISLGYDWDAETNNQCESRCLVKNSLVFCTQCVYNNSMGLINIQNVKIGDKVLTHNGNEQVVIGTTNRECRGLMTSIYYTGWCEPLICTYDHLIFVNRDSNNIWLKAHEILPTDFLVFPKCKNTKRLSKIVIKDEWRLYKSVDKINICIKNNCNNPTYSRNLCQYHYRKMLKESNRLPIPPHINSRYKRLPNEFIIDNEWLYLFGYYVANGFSGIRNNGLTPQFVSFAAHKNNKKGLVKIGEKFKQYGLTYTITENKKYNGIEMRIYSGELALMFRELFGHGAKNKQLPKIIMDLPPEQAIYFFNGYIDGDGYMRNKTTEWISASKTLCYQICLLAIRSGFIPSMRQGSCASGNHWIGGFTKFGKLKRYNYQDDNYIYRPIKKVETYYDKIRVYDLTVDEDHSFTSGFAIVHNCHRKGQVNAVRCQYILYQGTPDEDIITFLMRNRE